MNDFCLELKNIINGIIYTAPEMMYIRWSALSDLCEVFKFDEFSWCNKIKKIMAGN